MSENPYLTPQTSAAPTSPLPRHPGQGSPYGPYRNTEPLAMTLVVLFGLNLLLVLFNLVWSLYELKAGRTVGFQYNSPEYEAYSQMHVLSTLGLGAINLLIIIIWCIWMNKSCKNAWLINSRDGATALYRGRETFTPGWSVGWYFIPIANLWKPYQAMAWIRDASQKSLGLAMGKRVGLWWAFFVSMKITERIVMGFGRQAETLEDILMVNRLIVVLTPVDIAAAVFAMLMAYRMTKIQKVRATELGLR
ncbi:MAG: DUF4328 domain-containing protein [Akkermansiaceae bacterium]